MRRPTLIILIVLTALLAAAGFWQLQLAGQEHGRFPIPSSPAVLLPGP